MATIEAIDFAGNQCLGEVGTNRAIVLWSKFRLSGPPVGGGRGNGAWSNFALGDSEMLGNMLKRPSCLPRFGVGKLIVAGCAAAALPVLWSMPASAGIVNDPLHAFCYGTSTCADNGVTTPTTTNPPQFGFSISPGPQTGDFLVEVLVPNNVALPASYAITGTQGGAANNMAISGSATLFSATAWKTGGLDAYLGLTASPNNPIGAWLPSTKVNQPGATGYFVFQADLGTNQIQPNAKELLGPLLNISPNLNIGTLIVSFLETTGGTVATANSGALYEQGGGLPPPSLPEPGTLGLFATGLIGVYLARRRLAG